MESQSETTQTVSTLKLPVLKTGDYDLWIMRMEQYITHTDYALWEVIMNGDAAAIASASTEGTKSSDDEFVDDEDVGAEVDLNNLETTMNVSHIPTTRIHKDHPKDQII
ncbi:hypothetical protein Tco_1224948, partial [Tanacetum coccineum]